MIGILISALILMAALRVVARHDADFGFWKVLVIALTVSASTFVGALSGYLPFLIPVILSGLGWALCHFCYVSILQSVIVCSIWLAAQVGIGILTS